MFQQHKERMIGAMVLLVLATLIIVWVVISQPSSNPNNEIIPIPIVVKPITVNNSPPTNTVSNTPVHKPIELHNLHNAPHIIPTTVETKKTNTHYYTIQVGIFNKQKNAQDLQKKLQAKGFKVSIKKVLEKKHYLYKVITSSFMNVQKLRRY